MKDFLGFLVVFIGASIAVVACVFVPIFVLVLFTSAKSCDAQWRDSGYPHRFGIWTDCQIKTAHGWVPAANYNDARVTLDQQ